MNTPDLPEDQKSNSEQGKFEFLGDLTESRLVRSRQSLREFTGRDIAHGVFLVLLAIEVLRQREPQTTIMSVYANNTLRFNHFDKFRTNTNDLYQLLHILMGKEAGETREHLKDPKTSAKFLDQLTPDVHRISNYLRYVQGKDTGSVRTFFLDLETRLKINEADLRSLRRRVVYWLDLERSEQEETVRNLSTLMRRHLFKSELRPMVDSLIHILDNET